MILSILYQRLEETNSSCNLDHTEIDEPVAIDQPMHYETEKDKIVETSDSSDVHSTKLTNSDEWR